MSNLDDRGSGIASSSSSSLLLSTLRFKLYIATIAPEGLAHTQTHTLHNLFSVSRPVAAIVARAKQEGAPQSSSDNTGELRTFGCESSPFRSVRFRLRPPATWRCRSGPACTLRLGISASVINRSRRRSSSKAL